jgi:hypothetical protein
MPIIRLLVLVLTTGMTAISLVVLVVVLLGMGWLAVAVPVVSVIGVIAAARMLWYRRGRAPRE